MSDFFWNHRLPLSGKHGTMSLLLFTRDNAKFLCDWMYDLFVNQF